MVTQDINYRLLSTQSELDSILSDRERNITWIFFMGNYINFDPSEFYYIQWNQRAYYYMYVIDVHPGHFWVAVVGSYPSDLFLICLTSNYACVAFFIWLIVTHPIFQRPVGTSYAHNPYSQINAHIIKIIWFMGTQVTFEWL